MDFVGPDGASASQHALRVLHCLQEWEVQYTDQLQKLTLKAGGGLAVKLKCTRSTRIFGQRRDVPIKVLCDSMFSSSLATGSLGSCSQERTRSGGGGLQEKRLVLLHASQRVSVAF